MSDEDRAADLGGLAWDGDFVVDRGYRFVSAAKVPVAVTTLPVVGRSVWDLLGSGAESRHQAFFERVFTSGVPSGTRLYYDGGVFDVHAEPVGRYLRVRFRLVRDIRVKTLDVLLEDMRLATADLARPFGSPPLTDLPEPGSTVPRP